MIIDKYIHHKLKGDPNTIRRARFMIMYAIVGGALALIMGIYNVFIKGINANTIILLAAILFTFIVISIVKKIGNLNFPAFILCLMILTASLTSAWGTGGIYSMDLHPLFSVPMAAYIFKGKRYALYWLGVVALSFISFYLIAQFSSHDFSADVENLSKEGYYMKRMMYALNIAALVVFYEYSMKKQTQELIDKTNMEKVRQQIARDFHDEMGNKLAAITLNSNLLSHSTTTDEKTKEVLGKIEKTSKILYQSSRDFIWAIDTKSDDLTEIFDYLKDFGEDFYQSLNIKFYSSTSPEKLPAIVLPPYFGRHIIMLFKEAMTNAAKYSKCKRIDFTLIVKENSILIEVKDDGEGFNINNIKKGKGLNNMEHRAKQINGDFKINPVQGKGTQIQLEIKI